MSGAKPSRVWVQGMHSLSSNNNIEDWKLWKLLSGRIHINMHTFIHAWIHEYMKRTLFESTCIHTIANHILWGQTSMKLRKLQWLKDWAPMPKQLVQKPMQSFVCINDAHGSNPKKNVSNTLMRIMIDFYVTYLRPTNVYDFNEYTWVRACVIWFCAVCMLNRCDPAYSFQSQVRQQQVLQGEHETCDDMDQILVKSFD